MRTRTITLANTQRIVVRSHYKGAYRITLDTEHFGQIKRDGAGWHATIRITDTGVILRHAGIWTTLREAVAECIDWQHGETQPLIFRRSDTSAHLPE